MKKISETYKELGIDFTFPIEIKDADGNSTTTRTVMTIGSAGNTTRKATEPTTRTVMAIASAANTTRKATRLTSRAVMAFGFAVNTTRTAK